MARWRAVPLAAALGALALASAPVRAQRCVPTAGADRGPRPGMAHRDPAPRRPGPSATTVATMVVWAPPAQGEDTGADAPRDPYEERAFVLAGLLWRVRLGATCELELELGAPGGRAAGPRVLGVIPEGAAWQESRAAVLRALPAPARTTLTRRRAVELATPVRLTVVGWGYYGGRGVVSGRVATAWQLRPVWRVAVGVHCASSDVACLQAARLEATAPAQVPAEAVRLPRHDPLHDEIHLRCCDGTTSPCTCARSSFRGCCTNHGGVCAGCPE